MKTQFILLSIILISGFGCNKPESPPCTACVEQEEKPTVEALWTEARQLFADGKTNQVIALIETALNNPAYAESRPQLFRDLVGLNITIGNTDAAQKKFLQAADKDPALATEAFGIVASHLHQAKHYDKLIEWCDQLLTKEFDNKVKGRLYAYKMESLRALNKIDELLATISTCVTKLPVDATRSIVNATLSTMVKQKQYAALDRLLDPLTKSLSDQAGFPQMFTLIRFRALINQGQLEQAAELLTPTLKTLPDKDAAQAVNEVARRALQQKGTLFIEPFCQNAFDNATPGTGLFATSARYLLKLAADKSDVGLIQKRLDLFMERGGNPSLMVYLVGHVFYVIMDKGDDPARQSVLTLCDKLYQLCDVDTDKGRLINLLLDGSFMTSDFDRALTVLNTKKQGMEDGKRLMLIPKVKAHRALMAGKKKEAIGFFRDFMQYIVAQDEEAFMDPVSGRQIPRESVLGLNAVRIAGLWSDVGETNKASSTYTEAKGYYEQAITKTEENTPQRKEVEDALKLLPGNTD